jgi:undecaprenyl-diphosphatase
VRSRPTTSARNALRVDVPWAVVLRRAAVAALGVLSLVLVTGLLVDLAVDATPIGRADLDATSWIAERRTGVLDAVATVGSSLTDTFTVLGVLAGAVTMLVASGHRRHGMLLVVAVTTEFLVFIATSVAIGRDRPDVEPLGEVPSTASFPSGHVAVAIALYGGLALVATSLSRDRAVGRIGAAVTAVLVVYVGASRVYEGVHHPTDVAGGVVLGLAALTSAAWSCSLVRSPAFAAPARTAAHAVAATDQRSRTTWWVPSR